MNREEYMNELKKAIEKCSSTQQKDIISDFEEHFEMGIQSGHSEQEIINSLGPITEFIADLVIEEEKGVAVITEAITKVIISSDDGDVDIMWGDQLNVELTNCSKTANAYFTFEQREEKDVLYIELKRKASTFMRLGGAPTIELTLCSFQKECGVRATNGDITVEDVVLEVCSVSSMNGDINIHASIENLRVDTKNGDIEINGNIANIIADSSNGDIEIDCEGVVENVDAHTSRGDIEVVGSIQDTRAKTSMGDITCACDAILSMTLTSSMGDIELDVSGNDSFEINAQNTLGDVDVSLEDVAFSNHRIVRNDGLAKINLSTSMGDIEIHE